MHDGCTLRPMGFRFRRSLRIAPWLKINVSKSGISESVGAPGATLNLGPRGTRATVGLPGTGVSYSTPTSRGRIGFWLLVVVVLSVLVFAFK
jgi:hypothetical protein